jgi:membrane associated rhomboid family serine protease
MIPLLDDARSAHRPFVTWSIMVVCCLVFVWQQALDPAAARRVVAALGAIPAVLLTDARLPADLQWLPRPVSVLTSMFLHGSWPHLAGNMLYLWIYGDAVEDSLGAPRFLAFYLICGAAAVFIQGLSDPHSAYPMVGASGAISGVLGAYLLLFPRATVLTLVLLPFFFTTVRLPAMLLLLLWFAVQLLGDFAGHDGGAGIAFRAHIGGFAVGMALVTFLKRGGVPPFAR